MKILDALMSVLPEEDVPVRSVLVGVHWTVVCSRCCGLAATLQSDRPHGQVQVRQAGRLHQKKARELAELARSTEPMEASIGIAAINSMLDVDEPVSQEINASEVLAHGGRGKNVALVGHFPFINQLRQTAAHLWVIEQHPVEGEYPATAADDLLPQADVVAITGTALVNHTLDDLLRLCQPGATVMVLGPSTPLSPVLFDYGIDIVSGALVVDESAVLRAIGQGGSFRQVEGVKLLTLVKEQK